MKAYRYNTRDEIKVSPWAVRKLLLGSNAFALNLSASVRDNRVDEVVLVSCILGDRGEGNEAKRYHH